MRQPSYVSPESDAEWSSSRELLQRARMMDVGMLLGWAHASQVDSHSEATSKVCLCAQESIADVVHQHNCCESAFLVQTWPKRV